MFIGFGFLMTFLKRYGYSSVGYNFLVAAFVLEWAILVKGWVDQGIEHGDGKFVLNLESLLVADFVSAAVLISFGAVIGKASLSQIVVMATIEVVIQTFNEYIGLEKLKAYDVGESIYVHVFGAYFGLAVAKVLHHKTVKSDNEAAVYHSDLFAMIGTIFLWLYWVRSFGYLKDRHQTIGLFLIFRNKLIQYSIRCRINSLLIKQQNFLKQI